MLPIALVGVVVVGIVLIVIIDRIGKRL